MFKKKLRREPNCLNCGADVPQRYCTSCGQENLEPSLPVGDLLKETFRQLIDIDGRIFRTLKFLAIKPGKVPKEYCDGKRKSYTHPIRLFFAFGAIFLISFNLALDADEIAYDQAVSEANRKGITNYQSDVFDEIHQVHSATYHSLFNGMVYIIILSIPLFAFFQKVFFRKKPKYFYADYLIHSLYTYIPYFLLISIFLLLYSSVTIPVNRKGIGVIICMSLMWLYGTISAKSFFRYNTFKSILTGLFSVVFIFIATIISVVLVLFLVYIVNSILSQIGLT